MDHGTRMQSYDSRAAKVGWSFHSSRPWQCFQNWPMLEGLRCPVNECWNWQGAQMPTQFLLSVYSSKGRYLSCGMGNIYCKYSLFEKQLNHTLNTQSWSNSGTSITTVSPPRSWAMGGYKRTDWWLFWCMWTTSLKRNDRVPKKYVWFNLETVSCMLIL